MSQRLPHSVGTPTFKRLMFTADMIDAAEAVRIDLVEYRVPCASFETASAAIAGRTMANFGCGPDMQDRIAVFTGKRD